MTREPGLAGRLILAQLLVIGAGLVTFALVALAVGPPLFRLHLRDALGSAPAAVTRHVEDGFVTAAGIAIGVGTAAALVAAVIVSLLIARRLGRAMQALGGAAARLSAGDYSARMQPAGLGPEIEAVTAGFNTMAAALGATEATRRRMLSDLAHELRTPLATFDAYLEGLADGICAPDQDTWDVLAAQSARLRRLAEDIALVSSAEEDRLTLRTVPVSPGRVVAAAVAAARPGYDAKGVALATRAPGQVPDLTADPDRLSQVLAILLSNALRHTQAGGSVTVSVQSAGPDVRISVTDTGEGIAAEHLPRIFERFYRADSARDRAHGGSGIGLSIARALVGAHGGTLVAASDGPGTGATFAITLPRSPGSRQDRPGEAIAPKFRPVNGGTHRS